MTKIKDFVVDCLVGFAWGLATTLIIAGCWYVAESGWPW